MPRRPLYFQGFVVLRSNTRPSIVRPLGPTRQSGTYQQTGLSISELPVARQESGRLRRDVNALQLVVETWSRGHHEMHANAHDVGGLVFRSCATVFRISREGSWSDTARAMVMPPTSAHSVMIARDLVAPLSSPLAARIKFPSHSRRSAIRLLARNESLEQWFRNWLGG